MGQRELMQISLICVKCLILYDPTRHTEFVVVLLMSMPSRDAFKSRTFEFYDQGQHEMRVFEEFRFELLCLLTAGFLAPVAFAQSPSPARTPPSKVGGVPVAEILQRLGAKLESGVSKKVLDGYVDHFERTDPNRDGKHTREEYVENGVYMTPQARAGIFRAADGDADGVVTRAEYVLNRIITDEGKEIVQGMDDDRDGLVERVEFVRHATRLLSDDKLAAQVFSALDRNADGGIPIPEYLQIWGKWARAGQKAAKEHVGVRPADVARSHARDRRPSADAGPPSIDETFERFDRDKDGKLRQQEIPEFVSQFILPADTNKDDAVTKQELEAFRKSWGAGRPDTGARLTDRTVATAIGTGDAQPVPENCPACAMGLTAKFIFNRLDVDEDRLITVTEFLRSPGMQDLAKAREVFERLDKSGDEKLSLQELETVYIVRHANCRKPDPAVLVANTKNIRSDGRGDGRRFDQVFILRSDKDSDGKISKEEFRGPVSGFNRLDKNRNGFIEKDELGDLHQRRLNDSKSIKERLRSGDISKPLQGKRPNVSGDAQTKKE